MADHPFADAVFGLGHRRAQLMASATGRVLLIDPAMDRLPDGEFDTAVSVLALCAVPDLAATLAQVRHRLVRHGRLLFLEHVRLPGVRGRFQHLATPNWSRMTGGCHLDRDPIAAMRAAGFVVTDCERFVLPVGTTIVGAAVQGSARPSERAVA